jgi:hypothetical protein
MPKQEYRDSKRDSVRYEGPFNNILGAQGKITHRITCKNLSPIKKSDLPLRS